MSERQELAGIQYLRAVAVLLVVGDHLEGMLAMPKYFGSQFAGGFLLAGTVGVDLFFVISGFIIFHVTDGLNRAQVSAGEFAIRRFCRIVPFMWLCIVAHFSSRALTVGNIELWPYLRGLVLYPVGSIHPDQLWTLRHELFFYATVAIALLGRPFVWALVAFFAVPVAMAFYDPSTANSPEGLSWMSEIFSLRSNLGFAFGMAVAALYRHWGRPALPGYLVFGVIVISPVLLLVIGNAAATSQHLSPLPWALAISMVCSLIVFVALAAPASVGWLEKALLLIGSASYAIYLTHDAFISISAAIARRLHIDSVWIASAGALVVVVLSGIAVHLTVERFVVRRFRRFFEGARTPPSAVASLHSQGAK